MTRKEAWAALVEHLDVAPAIHTRLQKVLIGEAQFTPGSRSRTLRRSARRLRPLASASGAGFQDSIGLSALAHHCLSCKAFNADPKKPIKPAAPRREERLQKEAEEALLLAQYEAQNAEATAARTGRQAAKGARSVEGGPKCPRFLRSTKFRVIVWG